jgi:hypothetical protein
MRLATLLAILAVLALPTGCGSAGDETTTSGEAGVSAREVRSAWEQNQSCRRPQRASRWGCSVLSYRCQGVVTDRGWSISCSKPGRSIAFRVRPG